MVVPHGEITWRRPSCAPTNGGVSHRTRRGAQSRQLRGRGDGEGGVIPHGRIVRSPPSVGEPTGNRSAAADDRFRRATPGERATPLATAESRRLSRPRVGSTIAFGPTGLQGAAKRACAMPRKGASAPTGADNRFDDSRHLRRTLAPDGSRSSGARVSSERHRSRLGRSLLAQSRHQRRSRCSVEERACSYARQ